MVGETIDIKTFRVAFDDPAGGFDYLPGQFAEVSVFGVGESTISISSSPTRGDRLEFSVKKVGRVTRALHEVAPGERVGVRGPYGNHFPVERMKGRDILFVGGGIGLAPLRSLINYILDGRREYGEVQILYGARTPGDLVFKRELFETWPKQENVRLHVTVDQGDAGWTGRVGLVPHVLKELGPSARGVIAVTCGPPIMIKFTLEALRELGFAGEDVLTTLEMKMKCGIGKCGRCNIGDKYVCLDGPVFTLEELAKLPREF